VSRRRDRLVGFTYDETTGIARFSMYVPGTAGHDRKRATVQADSYDEAVRLWSAFRSRAADGLTRPSPEAPTLRDFITDFFPSIEANVAAKTARDYRYAIDRHLLPQLGALRLTDITSGVLNQLSARLKAKGYAGATVNNYVNVAALLLGYAVEFDVIEELPLKKKVRRQKANEPCLELSVDERARFVAAFDDEEGFRRYLAEKMPKAKPAVAKDARRLGARRAYGAGMRNDSDAARDYFNRFQRSKDLFLVALETGIRSGDLRHLVRRNIDFTEGWIRFVQQKTDREVVIPISRECRLALERALGDREAGPDEPVFVTENGVPYSVSTMQRHFKVAKRIAGIKRRLRSLRQRLRLPEPLAYWVDYWLFLHAAETHSIWRVRPLGLRLIAKTALVDVPNTNAQLLRQLADEAIAAARITPFLPGIPVAPSSAPVQGSRWHPEWMRWFETLLRPDTSSILLHDFAVALAEALETHDYTQASFITRRLAAELVEHEWSDRALFRIVKTNFCDANTMEVFSRAAFASLLVDAFSEPRGTKYRAAIELAPALVWPRFERILEKPRRLRVEVVDGGKTMLRGLTLEVTASHYDEAAAIALDELRDVLERLRLFHNVRTHAIGAIEVTRIDDSRIFTVDLPQPFWTAGSGRRRDVPHVPYYQLVRSHRLTPSEKTRWQAAQWHVSHSLAILGRGYARRRFPHLAGSGKLRRERSARDQ